MFSTQQTHVVERRGPKDRMPQQAGRLRGPLHRRGRGVAAACVVALSPDGDPRGEFAVFPSIDLTAVESLLPLTPDSHSYTIISLRFRALRNDSDRVERANRSVFRLGIWVFHPRSALLHQFYSSFTSFSVSPHQTNRFFPRPSDQEPLISPYSPVLGVSSLWALSSRCPSSPCR